MILRRVSSFSGRLKYVWGFALILSLMCGQSIQAVTDYIFFSINGDTSITHLTQGDQLAWAANCDTGATIYWEIWFDFNSNSVIDEDSDKLLGDPYYATDGDISGYQVSADISGVPDGWFQIAPILLGLPPGQYIFNARDTADGTSAQRILSNIVMASPANQFIGHVIFPDHPAPDPILENIWIETEQDDEDAGYFAAITDDSGYFEINLSNSVHGTTFGISAGFIGGFINPGKQYRVAWGIVTGVDFFYFSPGDADSVYGYLLDDIGGVINDEIRIEALPWSGGHESIVTYSDPSDGHYALYFHASQYGQWEVRASYTQLQPGYLRPMSLDFNYDSPGSLEHNIICYRSDADLKVRITENGVTPGSGYLVFGSSWALNSSTLGFYYAGSDNLLSLSISSQDNSGWDVHISGWDSPIPHGLSIESSNTSGLGPGDTAIFNLVGPMVRGTVSQDPEDATIRWRDILINLSTPDDDYSREVGGGGVYTAYPGQGTFVITPSAEGYLVDPNWASVNVEDGLVTGPDFVINKAHCRVTGNVSGLVNPSDLNDLWVVAHTGDGVEGYQTSAQVNTLTGNYDLWLCDGEWSIQPPVIDGYFAHSPVSMIVDDISDTIRVLDFGYASESCCGIRTNFFTGNTDCDVEGKRNVADITRLIDRVYVSKAPLCCEENGNTDGDAEGKMNVADITRLIDNVYVSKGETAACE